MRNALTTQEGLKRSLEQAALDFYIFLAVDEPRWAGQPGQGQSQLTIEQGHLKNICTDLSIGRRGRAEQESDLITIIL